MRAVVISEFGGPEVLKVSEVAKPEPGLNEILVRVHAAGVNPVDAKTRSVEALIGWGEHRISGWDVSGTVEAVGPGVTLFAPGDEVFGMPRFPLAAGGYAEYVAAPARHFARKPAALSHEEAAAVPLAALTAWQALTDTADLKPGQRVLVHAAAGGVGHFAVQIAKALGAHVIGTASAAKHDFVRSLGADEVVDYRTTAFEDVVADVDVAIDTVGNGYGARSLKVLKPGGTLITLNGPDEIPAGADGFRTGWTLVEPDFNGMKALAALAAEGRLKPALDTVLPLEEAAKAHEIVEQGRTTGKVVLSVVA
ncbi:NADP-dependent oxidoreductase [Streptomyces sp. NRRL S-87]|uniref:NADP-dependent oxidoreductase n=1 Tax=Streptomyces sp. NRRL S-87 TaxID=1463920 RepID=UPI0004BFEDFD|nr:NADP-dependent oxidoreductase [Streptomyces sp. NRRL S-87]